MNLGMLAVRGRLWDVSLELRVRRRACEIWEFVCDILINVGCCEMVRCLQPFRGS